MRCCRSSCKIWESLCRSACSACGQVGSQLTDLLLGIDTFGDIDEGGDQRVSVIEVNKLNGHQDNSCFARGMRDLRLVGSGFCLLP